MTHWVVPLHKKDTVYVASNYRGVPLTSQLSKAMERLQRTFLAVCFRERLVWSQPVCLHARKRCAGCNGTSVVDLDSGNDEEEKDCAVLLRCVRRV